MCDFSQKQSEAELVASTLLLAELMSQLLWPSVSVTTRQVALQQLLRLEQQCLQYAGAECRSSSTA